MKIKLNNCWCVRQASLEVQNDEMTSFFFVKKTWCQSLSLHKGFSIIGLKKFLHQMINTDEIGTDWFALWLVIIWLIDWLIFLVNTRQSFGFLFFQQLLHANYRVFLLFILCINVCEKRQLFTREDMKTNLGWLY